MAKIDVPFLVSKVRGTRRLWYWQPSAKLAAAGWKSLPLGHDAQAALAAAQLRNAEVDAWRAGGTAPLKVKRHAAPATVRALIASYKRARYDGGDGNRPLALSTRKPYDAALKIIDGWAGDLPVVSIKRANVQALKKALLKPAAGDAAPRLHRAHSVLRVLRVLMQFAVDADMIEANPASDPGLETPPPRSQIWSPEARDAIVAACLAPVTANGVTYPPEHSIALAVDLGFTIGQREGDLLKLVGRQFVEISAHKMDPEIHAQLARLHADGRVMGIRIRQGKTQRWVEVPVIGRTRDLIEAAIARSTAAKCLTVLIDERTSRPWSGVSGETRFQRRFAAVRAAAATTARDAGDDALAAELDALQFRDLRRTAVVYLGELGLADQLIAAITGHQLEETKRILETYMPRTTGMAARAIALSHARGLPDAEKEQVG